MYGLPGATNPEPSRVLSQLELRSFTKQDGLMPSYEEVERGYGTRQTRGSQRPGGYGWKVD